MLSRVITCVCIKKSVRRIVLCDSLVQLSSLSVRYLWNVNSVVIFALQRYNDLLESATSLGHVNSSLQLAAQLSRDTYLQHQQQWREMTKMHRESGYLFLLGLIAIILHGKNVLLLEADIVAGKHALSVVTVLATLPPIR